MLFKLGISGACLGLNQGLIFTKRSQKLNRVIQIKTNISNKGEKHRKQTIALPAVIEPPGELINNLMSFSESSASSNNS